MSKICEKCGKEFPFKVKVDGKDRNLCNRKCCLECSPFKSNIIDKNLIGKDFLWNCPKHGMTNFVIENGTRRRCKKCRVEVVTKSRQVRKKKLVDIFGGKCQQCGYNKCQQALQFHHLDPSQKNYGIAEKGVCHSLEKMIEEANKCILLCANCHFEVENGITELSTRSY